MRDLNLSGDFGFKLRRSQITSNGFPSEVDPTVKAQLDELNTLLSKHIFPPEMAETAQTNGTHSRRNGSGGRRRPTEADKRRLAEAKAANASATDINDDPLRELKVLLRKPLSAKFVPADKAASWSSDSLAYEFENADEDEDNGITLSDIIGATSTLSSLRYSFENNLAANWNNFDFNTRAVLEGYPAITDYLVAHGYFVVGLADIKSLTNFVLGNRQGAKSIVNYAIVSAGREIVNREKLSDFGIDEPGSAILKRILSANLSLSSASFNSAFTALVNDYIFNKVELGLIEDSDLKLPAAIKPQLIPQLIKFIRKSPIKITPKNANVLLSMQVQHLVGNIAVPAGADGQAGDEADQDFAVNYLTDDQSMVQVSRSAVKCAAQLFYSMILGDELEVFNVVNYFTHKYLIRGGLEISDGKLRDDLQLYVFSNKFSDLKTGHVSDRSRPAERHMFYRQVFNWGHGQVTDDLIVNREFPRLWKVLILESAKYLERAQISPNPDNYVSRQNVMQAVEDLQYNLSTHCTGMANVITPLIYAELNFVIQRILMHKEVLSQIVPQGGTWWRVVETLYMGMKNMRPRSTVLYNKAKLGDSILRSIANYDSSRFEQNGPFGDFISDVEGFITSQSILQESLAEDLKQGDVEEEKPEPARRYNGRDAAPPMAAAAAPTNMPAPASDEWAF
jgi:hypothetical protein